MGGWFWLIYLEILSLKLFAIFLYILYSILFIIIFCSSVWYLISSLEDRKIAPLRTIAKQRHDIHLSKLDNVRLEITRYRDLSWKIAGLSWAIYGVLITFFRLPENKCALFNSPMPPLFYFFIFLTALFSTTFLLYCEWSTIQNKRQRRELEKQLEINERWRFDLNSEEVLRFGFLFSIGAFLVAIWVPILIFFYIHT